MIFKTVSVPVSVESMDHTHGVNCRTQADCVWKDMSSVDKSALGGSFRFCIFTK